MTLDKLSTPSFLLDLDKVKNNIKEVSDLCKENNKVLFPMTKTHKSTYIANMQIDYGVDGFLVGTLDEAEKLSHLDINEIMLAYPFLGTANLDMINKISNNVNIILSLDSIESAKIYNQYFSKIDKTIDFLIIVNSGLNRFGIEPIDAGEIVSYITENFKHLNFRGIATHPGHVYKATNYDEVKEVAINEISSLKTANDKVIEKGFKCDYVATGSTPTFFETIDIDFINVYRPGNYVFYDAIQAALGVVSVDRCALTVQATIISNPSKDVYIMDAGSKCLGLDKGAHGNSSIIGYGKVIGHSDLIIESLSEEVGVIKAKSSTNINIGDRIEIIPNHSCSTANMTSYIIGYQDDEVKELIEIDIRGNGIKPNII